MELQENNKVDSKDMQAAIDNNDQTSLKKDSYFRSIKFKVLLVIIVVFVIGTFSYLFYQHIETIGKEDTQVSEKQPLKVVYYDMPPIIVNLYTHNEKNKFLKITISLVLDSAENLSVIKELEPSIRDTYFVYLRQLRPTDVNGPIAIYRLREALLKRTNKTVYPSHVKDLLFNEILVQ